MVTIEFETCNDAFSDGNRAAEIARVLRHIADCIAPQVSIYNGDSWTIRDANGNSIGEAYVSPADED